MLPPIDLACYCERHSPKYIVISVHAYVHKNITLLVVSSGPLSITTPTLVPYLV